ncbi:hypothetical protein DFQ28_010585 [Apophysomyces sp. BC1034]|nr:hypothetical protein DFQ30_011451 [Apophysomyces sp. BC1015]KAG0183496.1 hypothetical protein DFQ29_002550 [Apophysomyces sp. BC1021]KAG0194501.1 hypothetical protein DFQ28_010585 [Apophysomyces sp. BC1034]
MSGSKEEDQYWKNYGGANYQYGGKGGEDQPAWTQSAQPADPSGAYYDASYYGNNGGGGERSSYDDGDRNASRGGYGRQDQWDRSGRSQHGRSTSDNGDGIQKMADTIYISNLPQDVDEEKLAAHFGSIGVLKIDRKTRKPKTTLTYDDPPSADAAIDWFGGKEFMGNVIQVSKAERKVPQAATGGRFDRRGGRGGGGPRFREGGGRESRGDGGGSGGSSSFPSKEGDWACESCGVNNFARRNECFKCHARRSDPSGGSGGGSSSGGRGGSSRGSYRDGDRDRGRRDEYGRHSGGGRDDGSYRKDRHERRDRPY